MLKKMKSINIKNKKITNKLNIIFLSIEEPTILSRIWEFTQTNHTFLEIRYYIFYEPVYASATIGVCVFLWYLFLRYKIRGELEFERQAKLKGLIMNSEEPDKNEIFNFIEILKMYKIELSQCQNTDQELLVKKKYSILFTDEKFSSILKDENYSIFFKDIKIDGIQKDINNINEE